MIRRGADAAANESEALLVAVDLFHADIAELLLEEYANPNARNGAIFERICNNGDVLMASVFLSFGAVVTEDCMNAAKQHQFGEVVHVLERSLRLRRRQFQ